MTPDLRCPACGDFLSVSLRTEGHGYMSRDVPDSIDCESFACGAEWETNGDLRRPSSKAGS